MSATPRPWTQSGTLVYADDPIFGGTVCQVSEVRASQFVRHKEPALGSPDMAEIYDNARLIVRAVNNHDALVAALRDMIDNPTSTDAQVRAAKVLAEADGKL